MENVAVPEPTLAKPTLFHGYENENVDRWLQRFTLYLANRKIRTDSSQAATQLVLHLSGFITTYPVLYKVLLMTCEMHLKKNSRPHIARSDYVRLYP